MFNDWKKKKKRNQSIEFSADDNSFPFSSTFFKSQKTEKPFEKTGAKRKTPKLKFIASIAMVKPRVVNIRLNIFRGTVHILLEDHKFVDRPLDSTLESPHF